MTRGLSHLAGVANVSDVTVLPAPAVLRGLAEHVPDTVLFRSILYRTVRYIQDSDCNAPIIF